MMVCRLYKAFFSFLVIGWLCQIALVVVDVRAKRAQSAFGKYDKMDEAQNVKLANLDHSRNTSTNEIPYGIDSYRDRADSSGSQRYASPYGSERSQARVDDSYEQRPAPHTTYQPQQNYYQPTYDGMRLR